MVRRFAGTGLLLVTLAAAGCSGGTAAPKTSPGVVGSGAPVIVPGRPGEPARTAAPGEKVNTGVVAANSADIRFVQRMIPHHEQALEMAALVKDRSSDQELRGLADRINAAQRPEISVMQSWLRTRGLPVAGGHGGAGHELMPGMASTKQLDRLKGASGAAFDRLFLQLMIAHHQGALTMVAEVLRSGVEATAYRLALDVNATQGAEIRRMREMQQRV